MFVGRIDLLTTVHRAAMQAGTLFDLRGSPGSGKTAIVRELESTPGFDAIRVDMEAFDPGHPGELGPDASVGAVQASFGRFGDLLQELLRRTRSEDEAQAFRGEITDAHNAEVAGRRVFSLEEAMDEVRRELTPTQLADAWRDSAAVVADRFVDRWNAVDDATCRLLLLDNVDEVADQELGAWLGALLPRLRDTVVLLTRQPDGPLLSFPSEASDSFLVLEVPLFDQDEVHEYLQEVARDVSPDVAARVHGITGGHPGTLSVVRDLLYGPDLVAGVDARAELERLPRSDAPSEQVALLVRQLIERRDDDALLSALWASAVPRRFDAGLLRALLEEDDVSHERATAIFEAFGLLPFVEDVTPPDEGLPSKSVLRIHRFVRAGLLDQLVRLDADRLERLHARAATFHNQALKGEGVEGPAFEYGEGFVYEDPRWQQHKREWLYHRAHATERDEQQRALREITRVFFEAFWWWGSYVQFDFCDQVVADLTHMVQRGEDRSGSWPALSNLERSLRGFLAAYPPRSGKHVHDPAVWGQVADHLRDIQSVCGLGGRAKPSDDEGRKVHALLKLFLAHTHRYRDPQDPLADTYYQAAEQGFRAVGEDWTTAWMLYERADLLLERGEHGGELLDLWRAAAAMVQPPDEELADDEEIDEELVANLHRVQADVLWAAGDHLRAATAYRASVLHAYLFHTVGGPPDEYTLQYYVDIRARALNRVLERVQAGDLDGAQAVAAELARVHEDTRCPAPDPEQLRTQLRDGRGIEPIALAALLFPLGPQVEDLVDDMSTEFRREHTLRSEQVDWDAIVHDLDGERWPVGT